MHEYEQTSILFTQPRLLSLSFDEIGPVVLETKISQFRHCILLLRNYQPLKKGPEKT